MSPRWVGSRCIALFRRAAPKRRCEGGRRGRRPAAGQARGSGSDRAKCRVGGLVIYRAGASACGRWGGPRAPRRAGRGPIKGEWRCAAPARQVLRGPHSAPRHTARAARARAPCACPSCSRSRPAAWPTAPQVQTVTGFF